MTEKSSFILINSVQFYSDYCKGDGIFFCLLSLLFSNHFSVLLAQTGMAGMWLVSVSLAELFCGYRSERREMDTSL